MPECLPMQSSQRFALWIVLLLLTFLSTPSDEWIALQDRVVQEREAVKAMLKERSHVRILSPRLRKPRPLLAAALWLRGVGEFDYDAALQRAAEFTPSSRLPHRARRLVD